MDINEFKKHKILERKIRESRKARTLYATDAEWLLLMCYFDSLRKEGERKRLVKPE
jgi:hypothetical protein